MKDDKIIRAISYIDDAYILEAAPDTMARRRNRYVGRIVGIAAAAVIAVTGLFAFVFLSGGSGTSEKAADAQAAVMDDYEKEIAMEEAAETVYETAAASIDTRKDANNAGVPEVGGINPEEVYAADETEYADVNYGETAPAAVEGEDDGAAQVTAEALLETAKMPDGTYYVLVYAAAENVRVVEGPADFTLTAVGETDGAVLFKAEKCPEQAVIGITVEDEEIELSIGGEEEEQELSEFFRNWIEKTD